MARCKLTGPDLVARALGGTQVRRVRSGVGSAGFSRLLDAGGPSRSRLRCARDASRAIPRGRAAGGRGHRERGDYRRALHDGPHVPNDLDSGLGYLRSGAVHGIPYLDRRRVSKPDHAPDERSRRELQPAVHVDRHRHDARSNSIDGAFGRRPCRTGHRVAMEAPAVFGCRRRQFVCGPARSTQASGCASKRLHGSSPGFRTKRTIYLAFGTTGVWAGSGAAGSRRSAGTAGGLAFLVESGGARRGSDLRGDAGGTDRSRRKGSISVNLTVERTGVISMHLLTLRYWC